MWIYYTLVAHQYLVSQFFAHERIYWMNWLREVQWQTKPKAAFLLSMKGINFEIVHYFWAVVTLNTAVVNS